MSMMLLFGGEVSPAFDLNFLGGMPAGLTYTNSSTTRTYFGADGLLKTAVANEPIFEYDPVTRALLGMRWEMEQRTNLITYSEQFDSAAWTKFGAGTGSTPVVTANAGVSPSGATDADLIVFDRGIGTTSGDVSQILSNDVSVTNGLSYTQSVWLKTSDGTTKAMILVATTGASSTITVTGAWQRFTYTVTESATTTRIGLRIRSAGNVSSQVTSLYAWGAQLESGASASSYIPTTSAAVIRQPDVLSATSISPWYNQSEGTVVFEGIASTPGSTQRGLYLFSDGTDNERISGYRASTTQGGALVVDGGVTQADIATLGAISQSSIFRHAMAYKLNDVAGAVNGGTVGTDTSATMPTITGLKLGQGNTAGTQAFMGYARRFQYFPKRLPDAQIQGMSRV